MANTYYNSQLTGEEIEAALEAVSGLIVPANNGKIVAIDSGTLVAKSVTEYLDIDLQAKTVTPSATQQTVSPDSGYDGLSTVTVNGDADLVAGNIKKNVEIFGVTGSYEGSSPTLQSKSVTPGTSQQTVQPDSGYDGLSSVVVSGDADLVAGNIKKNVEIFGVTGTYEGGGGGGSADIFGLHSFYTRRENSMTWVQAPNSLKSKWVSGVNIGADAWVGIDVTDVSSISVDVATGTSYSDTEARWYIMLALMSTNPATINFPANSYTIYFLVYDEFHTRNSNDTLTIDVSSYTGLYYLIISAVGWNADFANLTFS